MTEPLWTLAELLEATKGSASDVDSGAAFLGVSIDTRTLAPGDIYVAIKGDIHDGHKFVGTAHANGAGLAIVNMQYAGEGPLLRVPDPLAALEQLGRAARARSHAKIIAVTGSVGKTGTKEMLKAALAPSGRVHASEKSYNNHWGVPLTLARLPKSAQFGVFEVGMNHPGEITPLADMIRPEIGIITTVEPVHLGFFKDVEEIANAKAELFTGMTNVPGAIAVLNADNPHFLHLKSAAEAARVSNVVSFGSHETADTRLLDMMLSMDHSDVTAAFSGQKRSFRMGAPGQHQIMNALAVLSAVQLARADMEAALKVLATVKPAAGRGVRTKVDVPGGHILLIDESYNANPASMRATLRSLETIPRTEYPRRLAVLGDMLELGQTGAQLHKELETQTEAAGIDLLFASGPLMRGLYDQLPAHKRGAYCLSSDGLENLVISAIKAGDVLLVKGSLGSKMAPIISAIKANFAKKSA